MANEWFIDPGAQGPFYNLPATTQLRIGGGSGLGGDPGGSFAKWGKVPDTNYVGLQLLNAGKVMPQFGFGSSLPTPTPITLRTQEYYAFTSGPGGFKNPVISLVPMFKSVAKLDGSGSMAGSSFVNSTTRRFAIEQYNGQYLDTITNGPGYQTVFPACGYIYRPSTQSVVGWLWDATTVEYNGWAVQASGLAFNTGRRKWACQDTYLNTGTAGWPFNYAVDPRAIGGTISFQNGDYFVAEWFTAWYPFPGAATTLYAAYHDISAIVGGTTLCTATSFTEFDTPQGYAAFLRWIPPVSISVPAPGEEGGGTTPTLTNVDPSTGPRIRLTFDNPVIAGGDATTIGPASTGLGVTQVEQVDEITVDLHTDYPPTHPIGEATVPEVPATPTGGGAYEL